VIRSAEFASRSRTILKLRQTSHWKRSRSRTTSLRSRLIPFFPWDFLITSEPATGNQRVAGSASQRVSSGESGFAFLQIQTGRRVSRLKPSKSGGKELSWTSRFLRQYGLGFFGSLPWPSRSFFGSICPEEGPASFLRVGAPVWPPNFSMRAFVVSHISQQKPLGDMGHPFSWCFLLCQIPK
jgi:hypothetical protein